MSTSSQDKSCPFCDPVQSYRYLSETSSMRVIYPKNPACAYHVLVTPKKHVSTIDKLSPRQFNEVLSLLQLLVKTAQKNLGQDYIGFQILSNNGGTLVNQHVAHCHIHVFLRTKQDKIDPTQNNRESKILELNDENLKNMNILRGWFGRNGEV